MKFYTDETINQINHQLQDDYYIPNDLLKKKQFIPVRLEVKYAYLALLNTLLKNPSYNEDHVGYVNENDSHLISTLQILANKEVDQNKMNGYLKELEDYQLIQKDQEKVYVGMFE